MKKLINDMGRLDLEQLIEVLEELLAKSEKPAEVAKDPEVSELKERVEKIESMMYGSIDKLDSVIGASEKYADITDKRLNGLEQQLKKQTGASADRKVVNPRKQAKKE